MEWCEMARELDKKFVFHAETIEEEFSPVTASLISEMNSQDPDLSALNEFEHLFELLADSHDVWLLRDGTEIWAEKK